jgi:hypothetical protein
MAAKKKPTVNKTAEVDAFMETLNHPLKAEVQAVRDIIKGVNPDVTEHIKWNAPSFCYNGDDRVTMNLRATDNLQLIFHRGAKVKDSKDFTFKDSTGLLEWLAADRAIVKLRNMEDVTAKKAALAKVVNQWMNEGES